MGVLPPSEEQLALAWFRYQRALTAVGERRKAAVGVIRRAIETGMSQAEVGRILGVDRRRVHDLLAQEG